MENTKLVKLKKIRVVVDNDSRDKFDSKVEVNNKNKFGDTEIDNNKVAKKKNY